MQTIGIDTGGTFTDLVRIGDDGSVVIHKAPSTPSDYAQGVLDVMAMAAKGENETGADFHAALTSLTLGTTIATNTFLTRSGAKVRLISTIGEYLRFEGSRVVCRKCGYDISPKNENHKQHLVLLVQPVTELSPYNRDPADYVDAEIVCRSFHCPGCATQIEVEISDAGLPPVWDCQLDEDGGRGANIESV